MNFSIGAILYWLFVTNDTTNTFDWRIGNTSIWLSAAAYCKTCNYLNRTYLGYSTGFVPMYVVELGEKDVQGIVGYMPSQQAIYVIYRGSTSIEDWIGNFHIGFTQYPLCNSCKVHDGFYDAEQSVIDYVTDKVRALQKTYPNYTVITTGHSLGAAMATLTALDLQSRGVGPVRVFTFGSPRIGNDEFAAWASNNLTDHNRVTHHRDAVVHMPSHYRFTHLSGEWYEDEEHALHSCSGYEDTSCSYQFYFTNVRDHLVYLKLNMNCAAVSSPSAV